MKTFSVGEVSQKKKKSKHCLEKKWFYTREEWVGRGKTAKVASLAAIRETVVKWLSF